MEKRDLDEEKQAPAKVGRIICSQFCVAIVSINSKHPIDQRTCETDVESHGGVSQIVIG